MYDKMQFFQNRDTATCGGELRMEIGLRFAPGQERRGGLRKRGVGQSESTIFSVCFSKFLFYNRCEFPEKLAKMSRSSENILISIVVPFFNEEKSIIDSLRELDKISIANEIILIDDGSTDSSFKLVQNFIFVRYKIFFYNCI